MKYLTSNEAPQLIRIELHSCKLIGADGAEILTFSMNENERHMLMNGLDDIGLTLEGMGQIRNWEKNTQINKPWLISPINLV